MSDKHKPGRKQKAMASGNNSSMGTPNLSNPVNAAFQQVQQLSNPQLNNQAMSQLGQAPLQTNQYSQYMSQLPQNGPLNNLSSALNTQDFYQQQQQQQPHQPQSAAPQQHQGLGMNDDHFRAIQQLQQQQAQAQAQVQAQAQQIQQLQAAAAAAAAAGNTQQLGQGLQHSPHAQQQHNLPISQQLQQHQLQQQQLQQQQLQQQQLQQQQLHQQLPQQQQQHLQQLQQHHQSPRQQHLQQYQQHLQPQQQYQSHIQHQNLGLSSNMGLGGGVGAGVGSAGVGAGAGAGMGVGGNGAGRSVVYNESNHLHSKYLENEIIKTFSNRQDLIDFVKHTLNAEEQCRIVINSSKPKAIYLQCERAGSFRTTVKDSAKRQRVAYTKRNKCAYRLVANLYPADKDKKKQKKSENGLNNKLQDFDHQQRGGSNDPNDSKFDPDTDLWILRMINPNHNHGPDLADIAKRKKLKSARVLVEKPVPRTANSETTTTPQGHGVFAAGVAVKTQPNGQGVPSDVINPNHYGGQLHHQQLQSHHQQPGGHHQDLHDPDVLAAITNNPAAAAAAAALNHPPVDASIDLVDGAYSRS